MATASGAAAGTRIAIAQVALLPQRPVSRFRASACPPLPPRSVRSSRCPSSGSETAAPSISRALSSRHSGTLLFQASAVEPAVLHAVLALSSAHQKESYEHNSSPADSSHSLCPRERFMLLEYTEAIQHLQPHFSSQSQSAVRVALATCAVFTSLEMFLRHYKTGIAHLHSGLKLLQFHTRYGMGDKETVVLKPSRGYIDDWIMEIFVKLHVQAALFGQSPASLYTGLPLFPYEPLPSRFHSSYQASLYLNRVLGGILHLQEQCCMQERQDGQPLSTDLYHSHRLLQAEHASWLEAYKWSKSSPDDRISIREAFAYRILRAYHTAAAIMISTCLSPTSETRFDAHADVFLRLLTQLVEMWKVTCKGPVWHDRIMAPLPPKIYWAVADKGWLPLLYYTALKCRNHRLRVHAIKLMGALPYREGIWNGALLIPIAREVVRIEERDFYDGTELDDDFHCGSVPEKRELCAQPLPEANRLNGVQIALPDHAMGKVTLKCRRRHEDGSWLFFLRVYDPVT
ncbi:Uu.00g098100.m01.CDS01 [Anthostomella pinea]|uniref:Uu.00g098100.m01.CDS01 n=1 Tax=Anthostomella pinea TaxID=933095 RepID=A0AAI8VCL7_9PEZI|nr:Uu.00g098100.m01.CDS01 [Anthostomella pinea]